MHRDMGLYDDRLVELEESRHRRRGDRHVSSSKERPYPRPSPMRSIPIPVVQEKPSTSVQSLLFGRDAGWTTEKAKAWAQSHGYRYSSVDITDQYIRIRQFSPKGLKVKRTITLGRGIRAVVAREESMAKAQEARRRRTRKKKASSAKRPRLRRAREAVVAASKPRRRRVARAARAEAPRRRRRAAPMVMEAPRKRRRKKRRVVRAARVVREAWHGDPTGHRKAARKGAARRKRKKYSRRRRAREAMVMQAPRRRRSRKVRTNYNMMEARRPRRRRSRRMYASRGSSGRGMEAAEIAMAIVSGGLGFILADGLDRFLATYDPSATTAAPTDKFTSTGAGTLANTLNVASKPSLLRIGAGVGVTALPAVGAMFVDNPMARSALEGMSVGMGVSLIKTLWNNFLMPLLTPKDTTVPSLQKSFIARLYPAEIAAHINMTQSPPATSVSSAGSGALSGPPADVGPFALAGSSPYPDVAQALRRQMGLDSQYPSLQNLWGTGGPGSDYLTAAQAMGVGADAPAATPVVVVAPPAPGATVVAPPATTPVSAPPAAVAAVAQDIASTVASALPGIPPAQAATAAMHVVSAPPADVVNALQRALPQIPRPHLQAVAAHVHPHVMRLHRHHHQGAAPAAVPVATPPVIVPPVASVVVAPPAAPAASDAWQPGPPVSSAGPQAVPHTSPSCGCGDENQFLGFIGDTQEESTTFDISN